MTIHPWNELIERLVQAKENKVKIMVPKVGTLIFAGALDEYIPPNMEKSIPTYRYMFDEIRKALKSTANLPKKTKTETIDLNDKELNPIKLLLWRQENNPLSEMDLVSMHRDKLKSKDFSEDHEDCHKYPHVAMAKTYNNVNYHITTDYSTAVMDDQPYWKNSGIVLVILGLCATKSNRSYGDGSRSRLVFTLNTGRELTDPITVWPARDSAKPDPTISLMLEPLKPVCVAVSLKRWNNKPSPTYLFGMRCDG